MLFLMDLRRNPELKKSHFTARCSRLSDFSRLATQPNWAGCFLTLTSMKGTSLMKNWVRSQRRYPQTRCRFSRTCSKTLTSGPKTWRASSFWEETKQLKPKKLSSSFLHRSTTKLKYSTFWHPYNQGFWLYLQTSWGFCKKIVFISTWVKRSNPTRSRAYS